VPELIDQIEQAVAAIRRFWSGRPLAGIILGTGMSRLSDHIQPDVVIDYEKIPSFAPAKALGHRGRLICGTLAGATVVVMDGRPHVFEGHELSTVTLPVRVMRALGAELLMLSNASGGLNVQYATGDVVVVCDHIDLMASQPFSGGACPALGSDQRPAERGQRSGVRGQGSGIDDSNPKSKIQNLKSEIYDSHLIARALAIARRAGFPAHRGVYAAMTGPNYETRAEYRFLRRIGADVVGMSTVPEAVVAAQCGMRVLALSTVTNMARPDAPPHRTSAEDVLHDAERAAPNIGKVVMGILSQEAT